MDHAVRIVLALPKDAEGVAVHLANQGVRGKRRSPCDCPIAHLLEQAGVTAQVWVQGDQVVLETGGGITLVRAPGVTDFISLFDVGPHFSFLEE